MSYGLDRLNTYGGTPPSEQEVEYNGYTLVVYLNGEKADVFKGATKKEVLGMFDFQDGDDVNEYEFRMFPTFEALDAGQFYDVNDCDIIYTSEEFKTIKEEMGL